MKIFGINFGRAKVTQASNATTGELFAPTTDSGITITLSNALEISTVFACIRVLSESVGGLPIHLYEAKDNKKIKAKTHSLYNLIHAKPNSETIAFNYYETIVAHIAIRGNHYSQIIRNHAGKIIELIALNPINMQKTRLIDGTIKFFYIDEVGKKWIFPKEEIFEVMGFSLNNFVGVSPITLQRETLGLSKATEKHGAKLFNNNATPGGVLEIPAELSETAYKRLKDSWAERHQGASNAHKTAILEGGHKMASSWHVK
ncbi:MAG: phage portal protein [Epsilonproteobacteria bacterium]|nr:phage portal protein [Campylobacterota bacterium]